MPLRRKPSRTVFSMKQIATFLGLVLTLFFYNEFLVYYVVMLQCSWPKLESNMLDLGMGSTHKGELKAMVLADTHLLGSREGHWFDKLRREWQMERSYQTALSIFNPDIVFILGDLFDEGKWASDTEFHYYLNRFNKMFRHPADTDMEVVVGNHDIGFHYMVDEQKRRRFANAFGAPSVRLLQKNNNIFVMVNSMAFEGDNCDMCVEAEQQLEDVAFQLECAQGLYGAEMCANVDIPKYSRPILMQHFPMYRASDSNCTGPDSAPPAEKNQAFKPKWDCLSKFASQKLMKLTNPRLIISGHTHHFCHRYHDNGTPEWTVPSFSWRNKKNPSFLLVAINNAHHTTDKCYMPSEDTVIYTYIVGGVVILLWYLLPWCWHRKPMYYISKHS